MTAAVSAHRLNKTYGQHTRALHEVSLDIEEGEFVALVGRSGSGKSTLLNIVGLLDRPSSGTMEIFGCEVTGLSERRLTEYRSHTIGFIFQAFHLLDRRTVMENIQLGATYLDVTKKERMLRSRELVTQLGLEHRQNAKPATLSGGERQRVAIARALVSRPRLVLCDEPTGNLDTENAEAVMGLLETIHARGTTVLLVTHDSAVAGRAQRTVRLSDGCVAPADGLIPAADMGPGS